MKKLVYDIYNLMYILKEFCKTKSQNEDVNCILTQIEVIMDKIDKLTQTFSNENEF